MSVIDKLENLNVSEDCFEDILLIIDKFLFEEEQPSYQNDIGKTQLQLFRTSLTGRNLQQENKEAEEKKKQEREAKMSQPKSPKRVAGGKKAHETRLKNKEREFVSRPIFQALNYNPVNQEESK